jgi:hypothetical protein
MARRGASPRSTGGGAGAAFEVALATGPALNLVPMQELTSFSAVSVTANFMDGDRCQFSVLGSSPEALLIDELATDVWVWGPIEQRFRIVNVSQQWGTDGEDVVNVQAVSYKRLLASRHIWSPDGMTFAQVDQGDIVWQLIQHTQAQTAGNWGVTKGFTTTGVRRDRSYVYGDNIGKLCDNLQEVIDGLWWDIDIDLKVQAAMPDSFARHAQPLQLGVNARTLERQSSASQFANAVFVDGNEDTMPVTAVTADIATDIRGRWETTRGFPTTEQQSTLVEHAQGVLMDTNRPMSTWQVEVDPAHWTTESHYLPGDFVVVVIPKSTVAAVGSPSEAVVCQVEEMNVSVSADAAFAVSMALIETRQVVG